MAAHSLPTHPLATEAYLRERLAPHRSDRFYLHLSDLLFALKQLPTPVSGRLLDFGCGGSPYASLFPEVETYHRADYDYMDDLDFVIDPQTNQIDAPDETYDWILSTQVLEHVEQPRQYLDECYRLLKPGGKLICTTHGTFEEHGCPYDFQRWTADGLRRDMRSSGLPVTHTYRLTTGPRAVMLMFYAQLGEFKSTRNLLANGVTWLLRGGLVAGRRPINRALDYLYPHHRCTATDASQHRFYIALMLVSEKPPA